MKWKLITIFSVCLLFVALNVGAVEVAPRISDREIIEKLANIESGQVALSQRITELRYEVATIREEMRTGQSDLREEMRTGQSDLREEMRTGQTALRETILALFGGLIALIIALFGYIAWDRKTTTKPLADQVNKLEENVRHELELQHNDGSILSRQLKALRQYARKNPEFAEIMRNVSLM